MGADHVDKNWRALSAITSAAIMALRLSALAIGLISISGTGVMLAAVAVLAAAATLYGVAHANRVLLLCCRVIASSVWVAAGGLFLLSPISVWVAAACFVFAAVDVMSPLVQDR